MLTFSDAVPRTRFEGENCPWLCGRGQELCRQHCSF